MVTGRRGQLAATPGDRLLSRGGRGRSEPPAGAHPTDRHRGRVAAADPAPGQRPRRGSLAATPLDRQLDEPGRVHPVRGVLLAQKRQAVISCRAGGPVVGRRRLRHRVLVIPSRDTGSPRRVGAPDWQDQVFDVAGTRLPALTLGYYVPRRCRKRRDGLGCRAGQLALRGAGRNSRRSAARLLICSPASTQVVIDARQVSERDTQG